MENKVDTAYIFPFFITNTIISYALLVNNKIHINENVKLSEAFNFASLLNINRIICFDAFALFREQHNNKLIIDIFYLQRLYDNVFNNFIAHNTNVKEIKNFLNIIKLINIKVNMFKIYDNVLMENTNSI